MTASLEQWNKAHPVGLPVWYRLPGEPDIERRSRIRRVAVEADGKTSALVASAIVEIPIDMIREMRPEEFSKRDAYEAVASAVHDMRSGVNALTWRLDPRTVPPNPEELARRLQKIRSTVERLELSFIVMAQARWFQEEK